MRRYQDNAKWLQWFAPFRALSISAAYLVPFFIEKGMSQSQIFLLQSVFSLSYVVLELPSGWLADRVGRARCIRWSAPIAASAMVLYGLSDAYWQFVLLEIALAVANTLISGADKALLMDSLKAEGREGEYVRISQHIISLGFLATAIGVPVSGVLVWLFGVSSTLVVDGLLTAIGIVFVNRLTEPPLHETEELHGNTALVAIRQLYSNKEARLLVLFTNILSASTYFGFWLAAPYYESIGLPVVAFGAMLAVRSLLKAWFGHSFQRRQHIGRRMGVFAILSGFSFLCMATGQWWFAFGLLGHDIVQALQASPLEALYNRHMPGRHRAMLNSVVGLQARLLFGLLGPVIGLMIDRLGLTTGLYVVGTGFAAASLVLWLRLHQLGAFSERR